MKKFLNVALWIVACAFVIGAAREGYYKVYGDPGQAAELCLDTLLAQEARRTPNFRGAFPVPAEVTRTQPKAFLVVRNYKVITPGDISEKTSDLSLYRSGRCELAEGKITNAKLD